MKLFLRGCHPAAKYAAMLFLLFLFLFTGNSYAQDTASKKAVKDKAGLKKTFYGQASFYSNKFNGRQTASGEIFSQKKMTCANNMLRLGTWIKVTNLRNGKSAIVKVNDRLHPSMKRIVDLTSAAARQLAFTDAGLTRVRVEVIGKKKLLE